MRPYKFRDRWVDLDALQCVTEPTLRGKTVSLSLQFAFKDKPLALEYPQEVDIGTRYDYERNADGVPTKFAEVWKDYQLLVKAWANAEAGPAPVHDKEA